MKTSKSTYDIGHILTEIRTQLLLVISKLMVYELSFILIAENDYIAVGLSILQLVSLQCMNLRIN